MPDDDPTTEELRVAQLHEEREERERARESDEGEETKRHARRADKAAYLREKLDQRAESERDAGD
ncbi:MAG: hypothetical protein H0V85_00060 [Thermoleophilaceae bacterium]|nr:hypothetical protein [Thermoleophilaceae bacterium]